MTEQLRRGLAAKTPEVTLKGEVKIDEVYVVAGHKGQPAAVAKRGGSGAAASWQARRDAARWRRDKPPILGLIQRGGQPNPRRDRAQTGGTGWVRRACKRAMAEPG